MVRRADGRTDGRSDGRPDGRPGGRTDGRTDGPTDGRTVWWSDGRTGGRTDSMPHVCFSSLTRKFVHLVLQTVAAIIFQKFQTLRKLFAEAFHIKVLVDGSLWGLLFSFFFSALPLSPPLFSSALSTLSLCSFLTGAFPSCLGSQKGLDTHIVIRA